jgi:hypothetical protein
MTDTISTGWGAIRSREECLEEASRCEHEAQASHDTRLATLLYKMAHQWRRLAARQGAALSRVERPNAPHRFDVV